MARRHATERSRRTCRQPYRPNHRRTGPLRRSPLSSVAPVRDHDTLAEMPLADLARRHGDWTFARSSRGEKATIDALPDGMHNGYAAPPGKRVRSDRRPSSARAGGSSRRNQWPRTAFSIGSTADKIFTPALYPPVRPAPTPGSAQATPEHWPRSRRAEMLHRSRHGIPRR
jgi:hypothetical protein